MISAGQLRDRVTVERPSTSADAFGGETGAWVEHCEVWAKIERQQSFQRASERIMAGAVDAQPPARIHVRKTAKTAAITGDMRFVHVLEDVTTFYNVAAPPQDLEGLGRILSIMVTQGAPT